MPRPERENIMKRICLCILLAGAVVTIGCAMKPESVKPAYISEMSYRDWTCEQLAVEQMRTAAALSSASDAQRQARTGDTWGVILLGLPTSSLSGSNQASEIGRLKGELAAIQRAATLKNCGLPDIGDPVHKTWRRPADPNATVRD